MTIKTNYIILELLGFSSTIFQNYLVFIIPSPGESRRIYSTLYSLPPPLPLPPPSQGDGGSRVAKKGSNKSRKQKLLEKGRKPEFLRGMRNKRKVALQNFKKGQKMPCFGAELPFLINEKQHWWIQSNHFSYRSAAEAAAPAW